MLNSQILNFNLINIEEHTKTLKQESKRREEEDKLESIDAWKSNKPQIFTNTIQKALNLKA